MAVIKLVEDSWYCGVMTEWRPVVGFEKQYEVSEDGVRSLRTGKLLSPGKGRYVVYGLSRDGWSTNRAFHIMLLEAFVEPRPKGKWGLHRDDDKTNNRLDNLYWGTPPDNSRDMLLNGKHWQANKTVCPRNHLLEEPNLVASTKRQLNRRTCRACRDAKNILRAQPGLDLTVVADACYWEIMTGEPNPYRRTISQALREKAQAGTHHMTARTRCPRGHRLVEPNLHPWMLQRGGRTCLSCWRAGATLRARAKRRGERYQRNEKEFEVLADQNYNALGME